MTQSFLELSRLLYLSSNKMMSSAYCSAREMMTMDCIQRCSSASVTALITAEWHSHWRRKEAIFADST